jgi:hypothetical protein
VRESALTLKGTDGKAGAAVDDPVDLARSLGATPATAIRPSNLAKKVFRECWWLTGCSGLEGSKSVGEPMEAFFQSKTKILLNCSISREN